MDSLLFNAIGYVSSPYKEAAGTPIQPVKGTKERASIIIKDEFNEGLKDLDGFSHLIIISFYHKSSNYKMHITPFLDTVPRGVFATRAPSRPNPVGISIVKLINVSKNILTIEEFDLIDGTPILDIKPFIPEIDHRENVRTGWYKDRKGNFSDTRDDGRFSI
jgi:tRNA-Thr(GGU) m(6)t(6)A37 methyltransferase TsaA